MESGKLFTIHSLEPVSEIPRGAFLSIGNFDGVHRGHVHVVERLQSLAGARGAAAVVLTFDPHPLALLRPQIAPIPLLRPERKAALLQAAGASRVGIFQTGPWLLELTAREFFDQVIVKQFAAGALVEGWDFRFGRDRKGDVELLAQWCAEAGIGFEVMHPLKDEDDQNVISSSRIRSLLGEGRVDEAGRLLDRPYRLTGLVTRGAGRGRSLGIPTVNLTEVATLIPRDGVYAGLAWLDPAAGVRQGVAAGPWIAACHIGPNATFGERQRSVEAHLLDFQADLYGQFVDLDLIQLLRGTRAFASVEEMMEQIRGDIAETRRAASAAMSTRFPF